MLWGWLLRIVAITLAAAAAARREEVDDPSNLESHWERAWDHASVRYKMLQDVGKSELRELRVLRGQQGYVVSDRVELEEELCAMMQVPRAEAELWWYAQVGAACNSTAQLPRVPAQEPALWALAGLAVVTRFGAILSHGKHIILDPEQHGVCHRMRTPDNLAPRDATPATTAAESAKPGASYGDGWVREVFVVSQPWGHTVFHFVAECLPKITMALAELQHDLNIRVHVPLSIDTARNAERVMVEEYLAVLLPDIVPGRIVSGDITVTGTTFFVTPTRCAVGQVPLLSRFRRLLHHRLDGAVAKDEELQQELLEFTSCTPYRTECPRIFALFPRVHSTGITAADAAGGGGGDATTHTHTTVFADAMSEEGARRCGQRGGVVVLVRRAGRTRRLSRVFEKSIIELFKNGNCSYQEDAEKGRRQGVDGGCGLEVAVYDADAGQSPMAVLALFSAARGVIAPHGAGLTNLVASRKGLHVLEFHPSQPDHAASGIPGINLCMLHLARALGLAYTGALMRPVEDEVDDITGEALGTSWAGDIARVRSWLGSLLQEVCTP